MDLLEHPEPKQEADHDFHPTQNGSDAPQHFRTPCVKEDAAADLVLADGVRGRRMVLMEFPEYERLSYEQASREGARLIAQAHTMGYWVNLPERLACLRCIMEQISGHRLAA